MKTLTKHITFIIFIFIYSCDAPSPIEFIADEEEEVEIDIINPEPNFVFTGYDSTGITNATPEKESVITLSRVKNTIDNITVSSGYGEAIFYDISKPILSGNNNIGFKTLEFGTVKFGTRIATRVPHRLVYRTNDRTKDTLAGIKHTIKYNSAQLSSQLDFPNEKNINISFINQSGISSLLSIKLPEEIRGNVNVSGNRNSENLKINLTWNEIKDNSLSGNITDEIIVGGIEKNDKSLVPLFRLRKFPRNRFIIPNSLIEDVLSSGNYDFIVFTFLRKIRKSNSTSRLGDVYFASQSIHNIWIKI